MGVVTLQLDSPSFSPGVDVPYMAIEPAAMISANAPLAANASAAAVAVVAAIEAASASGQLAVELHAAGAVQPWGSAAVTAPPTVTATLQVTISQIGPSNQSAVLQQRAAESGRRVLAAAGSGSLQRALASAGLDSGVAVALLTQAAVVQVYGFGCAFSFIHAMHPLSLSGPPVLWR